MSQTLTRQLLHIVFSTKHRKASILATIEEEMHKYLCGIARNRQSPVIAIGGMPDHVHLLVSLSKNLSLAAFMQELKGDSSKWIKTRGQEFATFAWQDGYGAFSISETHVAPLVKYIADQREHHRQISFQDELRGILTKNGVEWDERYVWT